MIDREILHQWVLSTFNKEGLAAFAMCSVFFFITSSIFAKWAFDQGQFSKLEESKFEMLEL